jgi:hypothetical protein
MLNSNLQSLLYGVAQLFRYGLSDLFNVRFVGDSFLDKRTLATAFKIVFS